VHNAPLRWKTALFTAIVVCTNVIGNLCLSLGMKSPAGILSPWVVAGVALLIIWTLTRMTLLSWADLSFVLPVTALGYPLTAWMGRLFLNEQITTERWIGTGLIVTGTILVGLTSPAAAKEHR
jgi:uncharacterized membrane protein